MPEATAAKRTTLNHADVFTLTTAFNAGENEKPGLGLEYACKAFPHVPAPIVEKKLRAIGALKPGAEIQVYAEEIVTRLEAHPYPAVAAEYLVAQLTAFLASLTKANGKAAK